MKGDSPLLRFVVYPLQAALLFLVLGAVRLLPADLASAIGGWLGRSLGPLLPVTHRAYFNLRLAFPGMDRAEQRRIVRAMWDNLGRTLFEYPHLGRLSHPDRGRVEVINEGPVQQVYDEKQPALFFGAHLGNFEVVPLYAARRGLILHAFARAPNNPHVDRVVTWIRGTGGARILPKGQYAALAAREVLKKNGYLAVLIDQKQNRGVPVQFFGHTAMTAIAPAKLALHFKARVLLCRTERLKGARYRFTVYDPLVLPDTGDRETDATTLTQTITAEVERWIREKPEDWLWLHRRWPTALYEERR